MARSGHLVAKFLQPDLGIVVERLFGIIVEARRVAQRTIGRVKMEQRSPLGIGKRLLKIAREDFDPLQGLAVRQEQFQKRGSNR